MSRGVLPRVLWPIMRITSARTGEGELERGRGLGRGYIVALNAGNLPLMAFYLFRCWDMHIYCIRRPSSTAQHSRQHNTKQMQYSTCPVRRHTHTSTHTVHRMINLANLGPLLNIVRDMYCTALYACAQLDSKIDRSARARCDVM